MDTEAAPTPESQDATTTPSNASTSDSAAKNRPSNQDVSEDGDSQGAAAAKSRDTWFLFAKDLETVGLAIFLSRPSPPFSLSSPSTSSIRNPSISIRHFGQPIFS
jgi:hypothetical protein